MFSHRNKLKFIFIEKQKDESTIQTSYTPLLMIEKQWQKALNDKALKTVKSHCQLTGSMALFSLTIPQI